MLVQDGQNDRRRQRLHADPLPLALPSATRLYRTGRLVVRTVRHIEDKRDACTDWRLRGKARGRVTFRLLNDIKGAL